MNKHSRPRGRPRWGAAHSPSHWNRKKDHPTCHGKRPTRRKTDRITTLVHVLHQGPMTARQMHKYLGEEGPAEARARCVRGVKAARTRLIRETTSALLDAFECLCDSRRDLAAAIRRILGDVL